MLKTKKIKVFEPSSNIKLLILNLIIRIRSRYILYSLEEDSNASIFCASIMRPFLKTLITQNLKLKSQNKTVGYDLHHFIYACVKNYDILILFWLSSKACKKRTNVDNF